MLKPFFVFVIFIFLALGNCFLVISFFSVFQFLSPQVPHHAQACTGDQRKAWCGCFIAY